MARNEQPIFGGGGFGTVVPVTGVFEGIRTPGGVEPSSRPPLFTPTTPGGDRPLGEGASAPADTSPAAEPPKDAPAEDGDKDGKSGMPGWLKLLLIAGAGYVVYKAIEG